MPPTSNRGDKRSLKNNPRPSTYQPKWSGGLGSTTSGSAGGTKKPKGTPPSGPDWMPSLGQGLNTPGTPTLGGGMPTNLKPPKNPYGGAGNQPYGPHLPPSSNPINQWINQVTTPMIDPGWDSPAEWWQSVTQPANQVDPALRPKAPSQPAGPSLNQTLGRPESQNPFVTNTPQMAELRETIDEELGFEEPWKPGWAKGDNPMPPGGGGYAGHTGVPLRDYYYYLKAIMQPGEPDQGAAPSGFGSTYKGWGGGGGGYGGGGYGGNGYVNPAYLNLFSWNYGE